jgi:hypothetical protein
MSEVNEKPDGNYWITTGTGTDPCLVRLYTNPDTGVRGFGFNTADGGSFLPLDDVKSDALIAGPIPEHDDPTAGEHLSDCAVHNGPALPVGPCDCEENIPDPLAKYNFTDPAGNPLRNCQEYINMRRALHFYATRMHAVFNDEDDWDTITGEGQNWYYDAAETVSIEIGVIAAKALDGEPLPKE